jgi:hypothetical protein
VASIGEDVVLRCRGDVVEPVHILKPFWGRAQREDRDHPTPHRGNKTEENESAGEHEMTLPYRLEVNDPGEPAI